MVRTMVNPDQMTMPLSDIDSKWLPPTELPELHGPQVWDLETWDPFLKKLGPGWAFKDRKKFGHVAGFACSSDNVPDGMYAPIRHEGGGNLDPARVKRWVKAQLKKPVPKIFANASYDVGWFLTEGLEVQPEMIHDIQIQAPLLDEYKYSYSLDELAMEHLHERKNEEGLNIALIAHGYKAKKKGDKGGLSKLHSKHVGPYATDDARLTRGVFIKQRELIIKEDLTRIYELERMLVRPIVDMRMQGVRVDLERIHELSSKWDLEKDQLAALIGRHTGVMVTEWDSGALERALNHCGIKVPPTRDGKPSITAEWLEQFAKAADTQTREVTKAIRRLRQLGKAVDTFLGNYYMGHQVDGRVHVQFNQLRSDEGGTVSGRFSSSDFNMQNLPARDEEIGPAVRSCVIPEEGTKWLAADYASQEPRLTVHWACRAGMPSAHIARKAYHDDPDTDYHQMVADICGIERKPAKAINLGLAYGMGGPKLCHSLGLPTVFKTVYSQRQGRHIEIEVPGPEGQKVLDRYDAGVPFVRKLFRMAENRAKEVGYIVTLMGRKCRVKDNEWKNADARKALNKLIQGSAADQMKETMRQLYYDHKIIPMVTVHDELGFSVKNEKDAWHKIGLMEGAIELEVPTVVDCKLGDNWGHVVKLKRAA